MNTKDILKDLKILQQKQPDLIIRDIKVGLFKHAYIVVNQSVSSGDRVNDFVLKYFSSKNIFGSNVLKNLRKRIEENIPSINYVPVDSKDKLLELLFSGFTIVMYDNSISAYETRGELDRGVNIPQSEPVIRGPKDSFTENYNANLGLMRKRIKSEHLVLKEITVGRETKSKVGIIYMDNICEDDLVESVKASLESIDIDGIMDVNNFKSFVEQKNVTFFPTVLYTEKPDDACRFLLEGRVIVTMDNSPSVLIAPTFFMDFFQNSEDYYHKPFFATFMRIVRFFSFFLSILTPAFFVAIITYDQEILPVSLLINFAEQRNSVPFPVIIEAFLLMFTFELLYEGDARTPSNRGTSLSILGALVLGDAAVNAGLVSPVMVIVVSVSAISSLVFIYYDMQGSIRFWRYLMMILAALFGIVGFVMGLMLLLINLCSVKTFGKPYTLPMMPFIKEAQGNALFKTVMSKMKKRPSYLTKNVVREE